MTESVSASDDAAAQRAAEQARLRKERREAKLKAGGSARLNKITGLGGRVPEPEVATTTATSIPDPTAAPAQPTTSPAAARATPSHHADPDEVDISQHYYEPPKEAARKLPSEPTLSEDQLRQMMLGFDRGSPAGGGTPGRGSPGPAGPGLDEDPLMKMMSQMMGGSGFPPGSMPQFPGMPGMSGMPGMPGAVPTAAGPSPSALSLWRILHALVALALGLYIVLLTPFTGTRVERERAALAFSAASPLDYTTGASDDGASSSSPAGLDADLEQRKRLFFWTFATAETLLLTTRFFIDKRGTPPTGILGTVVGFLPQPFKGYVEIVLRYVQIFTTVRSDMLACIFVLGAVSWWNR